MKPYRRLAAALMLAILALIPLGVAVSLNDGQTIKIEGQDSLEGVATTAGTAYYATGEITTAVGNADPGDTIFLWPKKYYDNVLVDKDLKISGSGALWTIVDGQDRGNVFTIPQGVTATLSGMTIQNGLADKGDGIRNSGTLTAEGCIIKDNQAGYWGGGITNYGTATIIGCTIFGNKAAQDGGGIENWGTFKGHR